MPACMSALIHSQNASYLSASCTQMCHVNMQCCMQALLTHSEAEFDFPRIVNVLVRALHDDNPRIVTVAIEALAVAHHLIGDDIHALLVASGASVSSRLMLAGRFASTNLPGLKADGAVEHEVRTEIFMHVTSNPRQWLCCLWVGHVALWDTRTSPFPYGKCPFTV